MSSCSSELIETLLPKAFTIHHPCYESLTFGASLNSIGHLLRARLFSTDLRMNTRTTLTWALSRSFGISIWKRLSLARWDLAQRHQIELFNFLVTLLRLEVSHGDRWLSCNRSYIAYASAANEFFGHVVKAVSAQPVYTYSFEFLGSWKFGDMVTSHTRELLPKLMKGRMGMKVRPLYVRRVARFKRIEKTSSIVGFASSEGGRNNGPLFSAPSFDSCLSGHQCVAKLGHH